MAMEFQWQNQFQRLQGNEQPIQATSLKAISKELRQEISMFTICVPSEEIIQQDAHPTMQCLLEFFIDIFAELKQLPLPREIDHHILLKEGLELMNVSPYKYAYFQKAEIEKLVYDMLKLGLIISRTSPFSSLVLLVKNKMAHGVFMLTIEPLMPKPGRTISQTYS